MITLLNTSKGKRAMVQRTHFTFYKLFDWLISPITIHRRESSLTFDSHVLPGFFTKILPVVNNNSMFVCTETKLYTKKRPLRPQPPQQPPLPPHRPPQQQPASRADRGTAMVLEDVDRIAEEGLCTSTITTTKNTPTLIITTTRWPA